MSDAGGPAPSGPSTGALAPPATSGSAAARPWPEPLVDAARDVSGHSVAFHPRWWTERIPERAWPAAHVAALPADPTRLGYRRISRSDVAALSTDRTPDGRVRLLTAAYVWGTGDFAFHIWRRTQWMARSDVDTVGQRLTAAADVFAREGARAAYTAMRGKGPGRVVGCGPAFFTKWLHFLAHDPDLSVPGPAPLVLDQFVAAALNDVAADDPDLPTPYAPWSWTSTEYEQYLQWVAARAPSLPTAAALEKALFDHGKALARRGRTTAR